MDTNECFYQNLSTDKRNNNYCRQHKLHYAKLRKITAGEGNNERMVVLVKWNMRRNDTIKTMK